jgi:NADPH:quinone reductase-like Zn-dependent oxidoreductase
MKAIICAKYGPPHKVLRLEEVEKPVPNDDQVLVQVHAASVTFSNLLTMTGKPFLARLMFGGLFKPKIQILGSDIAGRVEAVGKNVTQFHPGDGVWGYVADCGKGGYAEYVCAPERALGLKPSNLSFEEAAAVPEVALCALQAVRDDGQIQKGQHVLVYGASGGIGTFAVQIAKAFGAEVTGVCSTKNLELVRLIGADHVIDYTKEDFTENGQKYDLIVATAGYRSIFDYKRALNLRGIYVATGGASGQVLQALLLTRMLSENQGKKLGILMMNPNYDFASLKELIKAGKVKPVIDRCYPLSETAQAFEYYGKRHARGKVVVTVAVDSHP